MVTALALAVLDGDIASLELTADACAALEARCEQPPRRGRAELEAAAVKLGRVLGLCQSGTAYLTETAEELAVHTIAAGCAAGCFCVEARA